MNIKTLFATIALLALFTSCDEESESRYSNYMANFSCDASIHPYNIVHGYGEFIIVSRNSATSYKVQWANDKELIVNLTAQETIYGGPLYGLGGLIIGTPASGDGNIMAFDLACPRCEQANRKLKVTQPIGHAECEHCKSKFDLNSGGIPIGGPSKRPLWQYRVATNGSRIIITN